MISSYWSYYDDYRKLSRGGADDTGIQYVRYVLYAQIYKNGNCVVSRNRREHMNELYVNFKIEPEI